MIRLESERGATAILTAAALLLIVGIAAITIDISAAQNERRGDQATADTAALAGIIQTLATQSGQGITSSVLDIARQNLDETYTNAEWQLLWSTCTDPTKNAGGFRYNSLPTPAGWSVPNLDCISLDARGFLRVRVPDQLTDTSFGQALGVNEIATSAVAVARINDRLSGGILPFGLPSTVSGGDHACLTSASGGNSQPPCDGPSAGNFGTLKGRRYGDLDLTIPENCNASPLGQTLAINIAAGYDHPVFPWNATDGTVEDRCYNFPVNTLNTDTGFPNAGAAEGLATGPLPYALTPRLQQGSNPKRTVTTYNLDNRPLWFYLNGNGPARMRPGHIQQRDEFAPGLGRRFHRRSPGVVGAHEGLSPGVGGGRRRHLRSGAGEQPAFLVGSTVRLGQPGQRQFVASRRELQADLHPGHMVETRKQLDRVPPW